MTFTEPATGGAQWAGGMGVTLIAYTLGCFASGYYIVRWKTGRDIRQLGTGVTGATNVGRLLGKTGFAMTLMLDIIKGVLAVGTARIFGGGFTLCYLALLAVVVGHVWPIQLGFHGGKGIGTLMGGLLVEDPRKLMIIIVLFGLTFAFLRRFTIGGLAALTLLPVAMALTEFPAPQVFGYALLALLVLWTHRQNLRAYFRRTDPSKDPKTADSDKTQKA